MVVFQFPFLIHFGSLSSAMLSLCACVFHFELLFCLLPLVHFEFLVCFTACTFPPLLKFRNQVKDVIPGQATSCPRIRTDMDGIIDLEIAGKCGMQESPSYLSIQCCSHFITLSYYCIYLPFSKNDRMLLQHFLCCLHSLGERQQEVGTFSGHAGDLQVLNM